MRRRAEAKQRGAVARAPPAPGVSAVGDRRQGASRAGAPCRRWDRSLRPPPATRLDVCPRGNQNCNGKGGDGGGGEVVGRKRTIAYTAVFYFVF